MLLKLTDPGKIFREFRIPEDTANFRIPEGFLPVSRISRDPHLMLSKFLIPINDFQKFKLSPESQIEGNFQLGIRSCESLGSFKIVLFQPKMMLYWFLNGTTVNQLNTYGHMCRSRISGVARFLTKWGKDRAK